MDYEFPATPQATPNVAIDKIAQAAEMQDHLSRQYQHQVSRDDDDSALILAGENNNHHADLDKSLSSNTKGYAKNDGYVDVKSEDYNISASSATGAPILYTQNPTATAPANFYSSQQVTVDAPQQAPTQVSHVSPAPLALQAPLSTQTLPYTITQSQQLLPSAFTTLTPPPSKKRPLTELSPNVPSPTRVRINNNNNNHSNINSNDDNGASTNIGSDDHTFETPALKSAVLRKKARTNSSLQASNLTLQDPEDLGAQVWPSDVEEAFMEALHKIPILGRRKIVVHSHNKPCGRNELIADYIFRRTGRVRSRKQVSSHIQVLKHLRRDDPEFLALVSDTPVAASSEADNFEYTDVAVRSHTASATATPSAKQACQSNGYDMQFPPMSTFYPPPQSPMAVPLTPVVEVVEFGLWSHTIPEAEPMHVYAGMDRTSESLSALSPAVPLDALPNWHIRFPLLAEIIEARGRATAQEVIMPQTVIHARVNITIPANAMAGLGLQTHTSIRLRDEPATSTAADWHSSFRVYSTGGHRVLDIVQDATEGFSSASVAAQASRGSNDGAGGVLLNVAFPQIFWQHFLFGLGVSAHDEVTAAAAAASAAAGDGLDNDSAAHQQRTRRRREKEAKVVIGGITMVQEIMYKGSNQVKAIILWEFAKADAAQMNGLTYREVALPKPAAFTQQGRSHTVPHQQQQQRHHHQGMALIPSLPYASSSQVPSQQRLGSILPTPVKTMQSFTPNSAACSPSGLGITTQYPNQQQQQHYLTAPSSANSFTPHNGASPMQQDMSPYQQPQLFPHQIKQQPHSQPANLANDPFYPLVFKQEPQIAMQPPLQQQQQQKHHQMPYNNQRHQRQHIINSSPLAAYAQQQYSLPPPHSASAATSTYGTNLSPMSAVHSNNNGGFSHSPSMLARSNSAPSYTQQHAPLMQVYEDMEYSAM